MYSTIEPYINPLISRINKRNIIKISIGKDNENYFSNMLDERFINNLCQNINKNPELHYKLEEQKETVFYHENKRMIYNNKTQQTSLHLIETSDFHKHDNFVFRNETIEDISRYGISCFEEPHCIQHRVRNILHFGSILDIVISYINEDDMKYYTVDLVISKPTPTKKIKHLLDKLSFCNV